MDDIFVILGVTVAVCADIASGTAVNGINVDNGVGVSASIEASAVVGADGVTAL